MGISAEMRTVLAGPSGAPLLSDYDGAARPVAEAVLDLFLR